MFPWTPVRARSALVSLLLVALVAGCTGGEQDEPAPPDEAVPAPAVAPAPDLETVRAALRRGVSLRTLPDDVLPPAALVARGNSLAPRHQACVLGYLAVEHGERCLLGDLDADREVLLWGDVHAAQWIPALDALGLEEGWRVDVRTKYGCPPLTGTTAWLHAEERPYAECDQFNAGTLDIVAQQAPEVVLVAGAVRGTSLVSDGAPVSLGRATPGNGWVPEPAENGLWQEGLLSSLEELASQGTRVVVLGDTPYPGHDVQTCLQRRRDVRRCGTDPRRGTFEVHRRGEERTAARGDATYVDTRPWFCTRRRCPAVVDGLVVHRDGFTVGRLYATYLARVLGRAAGLLG
ncbi:SGNH hydrolase domain-containing protein [Nocardioides solisilvae]|uniref:SGNH hydrolase domain-containing protein n=1 Tax=Nocardioides solisilvae TaxID=1542435 RepID=UPI0013A58BCD|nr:SGNH hydrolase domain-containing protein [Nocardioides solisilvae]